MTVELSMLGKDTQYPTQYQPDVLFPESGAGLFMMPDSLTPEMVHE